VNLLRSGITLPLAYTFIASRYLSARITASFATFPHVLSRSSICTLRVRLCSVRN